MRTYKDIVDIDRCGSVGVSNSPRAGAGELGEVAGQRVVGVRRGRDHVRRVRRDVLAERRGGDLPVVHLPLDGRTAEVRDAHELEPAAERRELRALLERGELLLVRARVALYSPSTSQSTVAGMCSSDNR